MKRLLPFLLKILAKAYLWKYRPVIVAVTGNAGKTATREAIASVLRPNRNIRVSGGNLNTELGVPLTIIGDWYREYNESSGPGFWFKVLAQGFFGWFLPLGYPEVLVLEYGAGQPGDIKYLAHSFRPHVGVVTSVGDIPVHVEFFASPKELAAEKAHLVRDLSAQDIAVLNADDLTVLEMKDKTKARIATFGFDELATVWISNLETSLDHDGKPVGVVFKLHNDGSFVPVKITGSLGKGQALAAAAAAAVGLTAFKMNLVDVSSALSGYAGPKGRMHVLPGIKDTLIIDDTYNSSPSAMHLALSTLRELPLRPELPGRKIAVLGDMLELGKHTIEAHQAAGDMVGDIADILVCVGARAKFIAESAANQMDRANIHTFDTSDDAKLKVQELLQPGDIVLVKGSQGMRMEKVVEEIMAEPERKAELLVRQNRRWREK